MKTAAEKTTDAPAGRSIAQLAGARHGRSAAAMAAAMSPDEEYPVQRSATPVQLASAHSRDLAQLQAIVNRQPRARAAAPDDR